MPPASNQQNPASMTVPVALGARSYEILIESQSLARVTDRIIHMLGGQTAGTILIVTDSNVAPIHASTVAQALGGTSWHVDTVAIPAGESSKSISVVQTMYDALVQQRADRRAVVLAVGGGVVGDAAGFAAATYNRGIIFIQVPTSLLAMVDSSVGGKVGINHPKGKNLIGAFHQPRGVLIDPQVLDTLPDREFRSGLAEVVKYGVILDADFFRFLEENVDQILNHDPATLTHLIARSCQLKAQVVEEDEFETTGLRAVLNYGHTFGHAYEALTGYGQLTHGEAVAIGMVHASQLAERRNLVDSTFTQRQVDLLMRLGLPTALPEPARLTVEDVLSRMRLDKKNVAGKLRFILPTRMGEVRLFDDIPEDDVRAVLEDVLSPEKTA